MVYVERNPDTPLYHVGCGAQLFTLGELRRASRGGGMALACGRCGANAPIVAVDLQSTTIELLALPSSLQRYIWDRERNPKAEGPHLEYYLGFTDDTCPAKTAWEHYLRSLGLVSFAECSSVGCPAERAKMRMRLERERRE